MFSRVTSYLKPRSRKVAIFIVNYNMDERADDLYQYIIENETYPIDIFLIDNGSDIRPPAQNTNVFIKKNIQTTRGWLTGLGEADKKPYKYFAYMFLITSAKFSSESKTPVGSMVKKLIDDDNAVGVHASLSEDSTTAWKHLINRGTNDFRQTWFIDNICSLFRADWFDKIGRFDKDLVYAWGIDLETCLLARRQSRTLWIDEKIKVGKETDVGYKMKRMNMSANDRQVLARKNMTKVLEKKYGENWWNIMVQEGVTPDLG